MEYFDAADRRAVLTQSQGQSPQLSVVDRRRGAAVNGVVERADVGGQGGFRFLTLTRQWSDLAGRRVAVDRFPTLANVVTPAAAPGSVAADAGGSDLALVGQALPCDADIASPLTGTQYHRELARYVAGGAGYFRWSINAAGAMTRATLDAFGQAVAIHVGTSDADLALIESRQYDPAGNLLRVVQHPSGTAEGGESQPNRATNLYYDWRNRQVFASHREGTGTNIATYTPVAGALSTLIVYDNLDQPISRTLVDGSWNYSDTAVFAAGLIRRHSVTSGKRR